MNEHKNLARTLDNTSWSIADIIGPIGIGVHNFSINFTSNDTEYTSIRFVGDADSGSMYYDDTAVATYPLTTWADAAYQTVAIAGGVDATNPTLLAWFQQYAKNMTPSGGDSDIAGALNAIAAAISGGGGGGGMPADYPITEGEVIYEDSVTIDNSDQPYVVLDIAPSEDMPTWTVTINGQKAPYTTAHGSPAFIAIPYGIIQQDDQLWAIAEGGSLPVTLSINIAIADSVDENFAKGVKIALPTALQHTETYFDGDVTFDEHGTVELENVNLPDHDITMSIDGMSAPLFYDAADGIWLNQESVRVEYNDDVLVCNVFGTASSTHHMTLSYKTVNDDFKAAVRDCPPYPVLHIYHEDANVYLRESYIEFWKIVTGYDDGTDNRVLVVDDRGYTDWLARNNDSSGFVAHHIYVDHGTNAIYLVEYTIVDDDQNQSVTVTENTYQLDGSGDTGVDLNIVVDCTATVAAGGNYQLTGASLSVPFDDLKTAYQNHKVIRGIVKVTVSTGYEPIYGDFDIGYVALESGYYYIYFSKVTGVVSTHVTITCGNVILKNTGEFQNGTTYVSQNIAFVTK